MREIIAKRVAKELHDGDVVNLGIGLPTMVPNYLPKNVNVILQSENGLLGMGPTPAEGQEDDNLVNSYSVNEITAVFAHEFAHAKYRHVMKSMPFTVFRIVVMFVSLAIVLNIPALYTAFGFGDVNFYFATLMSGVIIWPVSEVMDIIGNYLSRRHEYQADAFAAREGYGPDLISALKRLNKESLASINPHPAMVVLSYSHPTLSQRIEAIERVKCG